jgi:hypothetical protein
MARTIVTTDPSELRDAPSEARMSAARPLTPRQSRRLENLPDGHEIVSVRDGVPVVRRPNGQMSRMQPSGRLVVSSLVERVQSYLQVHG